MPLIIRKDTSERDILKIGKDCGKCGNCCRHTGGFLVPEDVPKIAEFAGLTEADLKQHCLEEVNIFNTKMLRPLTIKKGKPFGACIFFNTDEGCVIHEVKPFQCRVGTCSEHGEKTLQWFWLNHCVNPDDPQSIREWASYLKQHETIPGGRLQELVPDSKKLKDILNYKVIK